MVKQITMTNAASVRESGHSTILGLRHRETVMFAQVVRFITGAIPAEQPKRAVMLQLQHMIFVPAAIKNTAVRGRVIVR